MSEKSVAAARERHEHEKHELDFVICRDVYCRAAAAELNRERTIAEMKRELRRDEGHREREGMMLFMIAAFVFTLTIALLVGVEA